MEHKAGNNWCGWRLALTMCSKGWESCQWSWGWGHNWGEQRGQTLGGPFPEEDAPWGVGNQSLTVLHRNRSELGLSLPRAHPAPIRHPLSCSSSSPAFLAFIPSLSANTRTMSASPFPLSLTEAPWGWAQELFCSVKVALDKLLYTDFNFHRFLYLERNCLC